MRLIPQRLPVARKALGGLAPALVSLLIPDSMLPPPPNPHHTMNGAQEWQEPSCFLVLGPCPSYSSAPLRDSLLLTLQNPARHHFLQAAFTLTLGSCGFCNQLPRTPWFKSKKNLFSSTSGGQKSKKSLRGLKSRCQQGCIPSRGLSGTSDLCLSWHLRPPAFLALWPCLRSLQPLGRSCLPPARTMVITLGLPR